MRKFILMVLGLGVAGVAYANCSTQSIDIDGKFLVCTTCCTNGHCHTTCF